MQASTPGSLKQNQHIEKRGRFKVLLHSILDEPKLKMIGRDNLKQDEKVAIGVAVVIGVLVNAILVWGFFQWASVLPNAEIVSQKAYHHDDLYEVTLAIRNKGGTGHFTVYCELKVKKTVLFEPDKTLFYEKQNQELQLARNEQKNLTFTFHNVPTGIFFEDYKYDYKVWIETRYF